jgi:3-oxoacyl-[acyl-carrier protein] reductase
MPAVMGGVGVGRLAGKVALVTGGSRGIGRAITLRLAADGATVALSYARSATAADEVVAEIAAKGGTAVAFRADSESAVEVRALVGQIAARFGVIDILVNNAAIYEPGGLLDLTDDAFDRIVNVNIRAVLVAAQAVVPVMPAGGRIISIGSVVGERVPFAGLSFYPVTKFAVAGLTRGLARDLGAKGITVNCVQPGPIDTDMNPASGELADMTTPLTALGRYGQPGEVANLVAFLASEDASYITGATLTVDGGFNA